MSHFLTIFNHHRKYKLAALLLLALPLALLSQTVSYGYDNAGNRIKREIIMENKAVKRKDMSACHSESLADKNVKIYPNPTEGALKIEITGLEDTDQCIISIYNSSGQQIVSEIASSSLTELNIASQPNGIYLMQISLNGSNTIWKIIKR